MTAATKRKHVYKEMLENFDVPKPDQTIVQILGNAGSNLHQVVTPAGEKYLASLPTKFRKNIWIKRGDYVVIEPIEEGAKVKAEIVRILYPQHIKAIKQENMWPAQFNAGAKRSNVDDLAERYGKLQLNSDGSFCDLSQDSGAVSASDDTDGEEGYSDEEEDDFSDIPVNTNRPRQVYVSDSEDDTSDEDP